MYERLTTARWLISAELVNQTLNCRTSLHFQYTNWELALWLWLTVYHLGECVCQNHLYNFTQLGCKRQQEEMDYWSSSMNLFTVELLSWNVWHIATAFCKTCSIRPRHRSASNVVMSVPRLVHWFWKPTIFSLWSWCLSYPPCWNIEVSILWQALAKCLTHFFFFFFVLAGFLHRRKEICQLVDQYGPGDEIP